MGPAFAGMTWEESDPLGRQAGRACGLFRRMATGKRTGMITTQPGSELSAWRALAACAMVVLAPLLMPVHPLHAADDLCGEPKAAAKELSERLTKDSRLREMHRNETY